MTRENFLKNIDNMSNHRILLWEALRLNGNGFVVELGSGFGSTPYLKEYCTISNDICFESFDSDEDWANRIGSVFTENWENANFGFAKLLFLDHAPGERRKIDLEKYSRSAHIIVIHDTEPIGAGDYQVRPLFPSFKYCVELPAANNGPGAWTTMVSNFIDLSSCVGKTWETESGDKYEVVGRQPVK